MGGLIGLGLILLCHLHYESQNACQDARLLWEMESDEEGIGVER